MHMKAAAVAAAAFLLSSCLVSEEPMFDAASASATPLAPGAYELCPLKEDKTGEMATCDPLTIELADQGLYRFSAPEEGDEEPTEGRFKPIGRNAWAIQFKEDGEAGYQYFFGRRSHGEFQLAMMSCRDLPKPLVERLVARGEVEIDSDDICRVKTAGAVVEAAKAYRKGKIADPDYAALRPTAAP